MLMLNTLRITPIALVVAATVFGGAAPTAALTPSHELVAHRAIYELSLATSRGKSAVAARGRILYDFSGSSCEGYKLTFRQVSELDNGEGKVTLSDLRSNTWENAEGTKYQFNSQNFLNERLIDTVDGHAERQSSAVDVTLTKPRDRKVDLDAAIVFPTEHVRRILDAAHEGKTVLEFPIYDGSETGEKVYNTLTVIGRAIPPDHVPADAAAGQQALAGMQRWPVTVSYFDKAAKPGEQLPVYSISFELYENGISRALVLDYNDFSIAGELKTLEIKDAKPCP